MKRFVGLLAVFGSLAMLAPSMAEAAWGRGGFYPQPMSYGPAYDGWQTMGALHATAASVQSTPTVEERVLNLPEDGGLYYVTIFTTPYWAHGAWENKVVSWFYTFPDLFRLKNQTRFRQITSDSVVYQQNFSGLITPDMLPAMLIQQPDGKIHLLVANKKTAHVDAVWPLEAKRVSALVADSFVPAKSKMPPQVVQAEAEGATGTPRVGGIFHRPKPEPSPCPQPTPAPSPVPAPVDNSAWVQPQPPQIETGPSEEELSEEQARHDAEVIAAAEAKAKAEAEAAEKAEQEVVTATIVGSGLISLLVVGLVAFTRKMGGSDSTD